MERQKWFSERYGYVKVDDVLVTERITDGFRNGIINAYTKLKEKDKADDFLRFGDYYAFCEFEKYMYGDFLKESRLAYKENIMFDFLNDIGVKWYSFFDFIECSLDYLLHKEHGINKDYCNSCVDEICGVFERENYAYRVDAATLHIIPITSKEEIEAIDYAATHANRS